MSEPTRGPWRACTDPDDMPRPRRGDRRPLNERLADAYIPEPNSGCRLFLGEVNAEGYGVIMRNGKRTYAHIAVYESEVGPVPAGLDLDHLCRVRSCGEPIHLEPVTTAVNVLRGMSPPAINARKTHCKRGHEFTAENTYLERHGRSCRTCRRAADVKFRRLQRERAGA